MNKENRKSMIELLLFKEYSLYKLVYLTDKEITEKYRKEVNKIMKKA